MLDITLRELWWRIQATVRRWRRRLWPPKDTGARGVAVQSLDPQLTQLVYGIPPLHLWYDMDRPDSEWGLLWVIWPNSAAQRIPYTFVTRTTNYPIRDGQQVGDRPCVTYQFTILRSVWEACGGNGMLGDHVVFVVSATSPESDDMSRAGTGYVERGDEETLVLRLEEGCV